MSTFRRTNEDRPSLRSTVVSCLLGPVFVVIDTSITTASFAPSRFTSFAIGIPKVAPLSQDKGSPSSCRIHRLLLNTDFSLYRNLRRNRLDGANVGCRVSAIALRNLYQHSPSIRLSLPDLTPNSGLWWYFFTEMFDHFRPFFLMAFSVQIFDAVKSSVLNLFVGTPCHLCSPDLYQVSVRVMHVVGNAF